MSWAEVISQRYRLHKEFKEEIEEVLKECLQELEDLSVPTSLSLTSHYPLEWMVCIGLKKFILKGDDIYRAKEMYDGNGLIHSHDRNTQEVLQEILLEEFSKNF
ncbi:hypothetical protein [Paenibacillus bovis]|uniref:Uncharacterized protein n=1 Tax=Paenibacillus bovis TaxID=1616788 RepID=A0A172ZJ45_9BACL|nr:hypothetical protein [Paenibacillus bovis]ANF97297.1 hypothetical protein AR543_15665 [Paenibacillus bovis]